MDVVEQPLGTQRSPSRRARAAVAVAVGALAVAAMLFRIRLSPWSGGGQTDFDQVWFAARAMWHHENPYSLVGPGRPFEWPWPLFYPLTTAVAVLPLAALPLALARALFVAGSAGALTYVLTRERWDRLAVLASGCAVSAFLNGQWSALLTAAGASPSLSALLVLKPNLCVAFVVASLSRRVLRDVAIAGIVLGAVSLAFDPHWIPAWREAVASGIHFRTLMTRPLGVILLLSLLRWRQFDARLLLAMACVPQTPVVYEALPLFLVPRTQRETLVLLTLSCLEMPLEIATVGAVRGTRAADIAADVMLVVLYLPCLVMILRRPNEGDVPAWLDHVLRPVEERLARLRGRTVTTDPARSGAHDRR